MIDTAPVIHLTVEDCLFVQYPVPQRGIVCSNAEPATRLARRLDHPQEHRCSWGSCAVIGERDEEKVFVACAPVGTGAGLLFTELCVAAAKYILRYGSDEVKNPSEADAFLIKIVDEADDLYGFNQQRGVDPQEWGQSARASARMVDALVAAAKKAGHAHEVRICHHLENYHGLRSPEKFSSERRRRLEVINQRLLTHQKTAGYDRESAVLFRLAKDFGRHAATGLQTVNKEDRLYSSYERKNYQKSLEAEEAIFFDYVYAVIRRLKDD